MVQVEQLLGQFPGTDAILSETGIGVTTLAGFLAEVGDLLGYDSDSEHRVACGVENWN